MAPNRWWSTFRVLHLCHYATNSQSILCFQCSSTWYDSDNDDITEVICSQLNIGVACVTHFTEGRSVPWLARVKISVRNTCIIRPSAFWVTVKYVIKHGSYHHNKEALLMGTDPGPWFNIKMSSYQYRKSHCGDKTILRPSYLHKGISYTDKMSSLYWIRAQGWINQWSLCYGGVPSQIDNIPCVTILVVPFPGKQL